MSSAKTKKRATASTRAKSQQQDTGPRSGDFNVAFAMHPRLHRLEFKSESGEVPGELGMSLTIGLSRFGRNELGVELGMIVEDKPDLHAEVTYRAVFEVKGPEADLEQIMARVAKSTAPAVLLPFLREAVANTAARAGIPTLMPPIVMLDEFVDTETIQVPPFDPSSAEDPDSTESDID